jgi:type IV secretory pathway VirB6-like protein
VKNNFKKFIRYLLVVLPLVICLSGCGVVSCLNGNSSNCVFGAQVGGFQMGIPTLPNLASMEAQQFNTTTVLVSANSSTWINTGVTVNQGEDITIQIYPTSTYPLNGDQFVGNGTINTCYATDSCNFQNTQWNIFYTFSFISPTTAAGCTFNYSNPGTMQLFALNPNSPTQYISLCGEIGTNCITTPNCQADGSNGFNQGSISCQGLNGQGLSMMFSSNSNMSSPIVLNNFSDQFGVGNISLDPAQTTFTYGAFIYPVTNPEQMSYFNPNIPWQYFPNVNYNIDNPNYLQASISANYNLSHVITGCWGVNGTMDTPAANNIGKLMYTISSSPPVNAPSNTFVGSTPFSSPASGTLYLQVYDTDYSDNVGQYEVQIITPIPQSQSFIDTMTSWVINAIQNQVSYMSDQFFTDIANNTSFINIVRTMLVLYIVIYGISFALGLVMVTQKDVVMRICKIGLVLAVISGNSWTFFNTYLFDAFTNGLPYLASIASGGDGSVTDLFSFADVATEYLTNLGVWARIWTFTFLYPVGWYIFLIILYSVLTFCIALLEAFIAYLVAMTAIALFIAMGPLFIILVLFNYTRSIFDNWVKLMVSFLLTPVILFSCIGVVSNLVLNALNNLLLESEFRCVIPIYIDIGIVNIDVVCFSVLIPNPSDILNIICLTIVLFILTNLLRKLPKFVEGVARFLSGGPASATITQVAANVKSSAISNTKSFLGIDQESINRRDIQQRRALRGIEAHAPGNPQEQKDNVQPPPPKP